MAAACTVAQAECADTVRRRRSWGAATAFAASKRRFPNHTYRCVGHTGHIPTGMDVETVYTELQVVSPVGVLPMGVLLLFDDPEAASLCTQNKRMCTRPMKAFTLAVNSNPIQVICMGEDFICWLHVVWCGAWVSPHGRVHNR